MNSSLNSVVAHFETSFNPIELTINSYHMTGTWAKTKASPYTVTGVMLGAGGKRGQL